METRARSPDFLKDPSEIARSSQAISNRFPTRSRNARRFVSS